jgi:hypothetical protein
MVLLNIFQRFWPKIKSKMFLYPKSKIKIVFIPYKTLKNSFRIAKDKFNPILCEGVYQIPLSCGKSYIGKTNRSL